MVANAHRIFPVDHFQTDSNQNTVKLKIYIVIINEYNICLVVNSHPVVILDTIPVCNFSMLRI